MPLALFSEGCGDREVALEALNQKRIDFTIHFCSTSYAGVLASLASGRCVSAILASTVNNNFRILGEKEGFPQLKKLELSIAYREQDNTKSSYLFAQLVKDYFYNKKL
ncbi:hypothetical protein [Vibrio salinus]|uniref:hypothetical protein n=1 Tax=Vibrio salinus TaxID=2899784 RepID=UPI001E2E79A6|nr:hypothetical protein [Vibrio salinus]MCE0494756.1 hypothetical protein [Vibrio salinus]